MSVIEFTFKESFISKIPSEIYLRKLLPHIALFVLKIL